MLFGYNKYLIIGAFVLFSSVASLAKDKTKVDELLPQGEKVNLKDKLPVRAEYTPFDGNNRSSLNSQNPSLLFPQDNLDIFYSNLFEYKQNGGVLPKNLEVSKEKESVTEDRKGEEGRKGEGDTLKRYINQSEQVISPSFYLSSILYENKNNWTIWLSGKKIRNEKASREDSFKIVDINPNRIVAIWRDRDIESLSPKYSSELRSIKPIKNQKNGYEWNMVSPKKGIYMDSVKGSVKFTLFPNQTFSVFYMKIFEGMVGDVLIDEAGQGTLINKDGSPESKEVNPQKELGEEQLEGLDL